MRYACVYWRADLFASKRAFSKGLWIRHVKGHSNHAWNKVADKLAGEGGKRGQNLATVRREVVQRMIANAWAQRRDGEMELWNEWRHSGWVTTRKEGAFAGMLEAGHMDIRGAYRGEADDVRRL